jgi:anti-anti-sigma regulatory factor
VGSDLTKPHDSLYFCFTFSTSLLIVGLFQTDPSIAKKPVIRQLIIDCSGFTTIDCMGVFALREIFTEMQIHGISVAFACAKAPVRQMFDASGFYELVSKKNFYPTIHDAVIASELSGQIQSANDGNV